MRILVADDDPIFRAMLARALSAWGWAPVLAADGDEAEAALAAPERPRLALLDWEMPGLDGPELCRRCRQRAGPRTYAILLTVHDSHAHITKGLEAGADDYLAKPMHHLMLRRRLEVWQRLLELEGTAAPALHAAAG